MARRHWNSRPTHSGHAWTQQQIDDLRLLAHEGIPIRVIARALQRTVQAVRHRARLEGIPLSVERKRPKKDTKN